MGLDIRKPIGWLFICLGLLLFGTGILMPPADYHKSLGINVDLGWGLILILGGILSLSLSYLAARRPKK